MKVPIIIKLSKNLDAVEHFFASCRVSLFLTFLRIFFCSRLFDPPSLELSARCEKVQRESPPCILAGFLFFFFYFFFSIFSVSLLDAPLGSRKSTRSLPSPQSA